MPRAALLLLLSAVTGIASVASADVSEIEGLQAWYTTDSLHDTLKNGERVARWPDSSGNDRHLVDDENGRPATFLVARIGKHAVVRFDKGNTHSVAKPFDLDDHTIFIVYKAERASRALFRNEADGKEADGVALRHEGKFDVCQSGANKAAYGRETHPSGDFTITALGRESGALHAFVNGADVSSGERFDGKLRVGRFFGLKHTQYVKSDGQGLQIAEMLFFDRYLEKTERSKVIHYLLAKYDIAFMAQAGAILGVSQRQDVNAPETQPRAVRWDVHRELRAPFRHDPEGDPTRLFCDEDATRVRLKVELPMSATVPGTKVRVLVLKNDAEYLEEQAEAAPTMGEQPPYTATARLLATLTMNGGDHVEIVTVAAGEAGEVTLDPAEATLRAEVLP